MSRAPSPHVVLALQAGLVSQELLGALTAVDDDLRSACLFAEYWDTHSDRDAWLRQHLSSQFHSLAVLLHQWCCEQSASWVRGAVHIPPFRSPASCKPTAPSSFTTTGGNGSKRRYAAITSGGRHRPCQSSSQPPDGPLVSNAAREHEEYQQVLEVTLYLIASLETCRTSDRQARRKTDSHSAEPRPRPQYSKYTPDGTNICPDYNTRGCVSNKCWSTWWRAPTPFVSTRPTTFSTSCVVRG